MTPRDDEFAALCRGFGRLDLVDDPRFSTMEARRLHYRDLRGLLDPIALEKDVAAFFSLLA